MIRNTRDWSKTGRRTAYALSIGTVAGVAAWGSYWHQVDVAVLAHQAGTLAYTLPLSVDGMLVAATTAMSEDKANGRKPRGWARFAFWLGAVVSVAANITSTAVHYGDPVSLVVSMWAPIALLVTVEIMARPGKPKKPEASEAPAVTARVVPEAPEPVEIQAAQVVDAEAANLPVPVSPAPQRARGSRESAARVGPLASGPSRRSPLTGRVLLDEPPKA
jgi:hypothetical protein